MRRMDNRLVKLAAVALMAVAEGAAQEAQSSGRRIVVSIPDRKLALQALLLDPLMASFDISEASAMLDEMLAASKPVLPRFFES